MAVAFAAKDALANVFGSLVIVLDKPFKIGDWITANGVEGVVEEISFRSTCVRTFPQELVYIPNSLLSNTPITNFTARQKRRIDFTLGLTYSSTQEQIADFIQRMKDYLSNHPDIYPDVIRVHFINYGASSLDIRVTCYARTGDHVKYLDVLNDVNLAVLELLKKSGVSCAFPSTSVYFETPLHKTAATQAPFPIEEKAKL
ncbi:protein containing Mechanosensitive ion channel MscS domain protein [gut metagenome]|uniref:Protein containing Mechanosensitive ion channel MscS domain protein n=1 Tax=gut metagenome TaxID=749906 RepID=J9CB09_9ZZZZ